MIPMPDLEPTRLSSGTENGPRPCVFEPPAWNWSKSDDTGWWVRADWAAALLREGRLPLDEWKKTGRLTTVKRGPHRVVYRADLPGRVGLRQALPGPQLPGQGSPVVPERQGPERRTDGPPSSRRSACRRSRPVALGERRVHRFLLENYLVTKEIARIPCRSTSSSSDGSP